MEQNNVQEIQRSLQIPIPTPFSAEEGIGIIRQINNYIDTNNIPQEQKTFSFNITYPDDPNFTYTTSLERLNLDLERDKDLAYDNGFIISEPQSIKRDIKAENGIFSPKFGQSLSDVNPYIDRYSCKCRNPDLKGRIHLGIMCPKCKTKVKYVGDRYDYYGYIVIHDYWIIHPNLYSAIESFMGPGAITEQEKRSKLYNIIKYAGLVDPNGKDIDPDPSTLPPDEPFFGIGMIEFYNRFDEIMEYYHNKYPKKEELYQNIMENRDKIWTQSIPVFTTHLRPFDIKQDIKNNTMHFEPINAIYNLINNLASQINKNKTNIAKKKKPKNTLLFDIQKEYMALYDEIIAILSGKKGKLRQLTGG